MTLDHGAPVEDIAWLPSGSLLVSVGGQDACVWDVLGGGRLLKRLRCHQKTIMSCHVAADGGPPAVVRELRQCAARKRRAGDGAEAS
jgi:U3 small nucleolar RNA-associated protein 15